MSKFGDYIKEYQDKLKSDRKKKIKNSESKQLDSEPKEKYSYYQGNYSNNYDNWRTEKKDKEIYSWDKSKPYSSIWSGFSTYKDNKQELRESLKSVSKIILVAHEKPRDLSIGYRSVINPMVIGSPNILLDSDLVVKNTAANKIDILAGEALLLSTFASTVDYKYSCRIEGLNSTYKNSCAKLLWQAVETEHAYKHQIKLAPGFEPYFHSKIEASNLKTKADQLQNELNKENVDPKVILTALVYKLENLNNNPITLGTCETQINNYLDSLTNLPDTQARYGKSVDIINELFREQDDKSENNSKAELPNPGKSDQKESSDKKGDKSESSESSEGSQGSEDSESSNSKESGKTLEEKLKDALAKVETISQAKDIEKVSKDAVISNKSEGYSDEIFKIEKIIATDFESENAFTHSKFFNKTAKTNNTLTYLDTRARVLTGKLQFRNDKREWEEYGFKSGDLDEGSLEKLGYGHTNVFSRKELESSPSILIGLLVDESGSMGSNNRYIIAKETAYITAKALSSINNIDVAVYGHSGNNNADIYRYVTPESRDLAPLKNISARTGNYDSYAVRSVGRELSTYSNERKYLFLISDGLPCGHHYGGEDAITHIKKMADACLAEGVKVFGIGIDNAYNHSTGVKMFGENNFVVLKDTRSLEAVLGAWITKICK